MLVNLLLQPWQEVASWMRNFYDAREDPSGLGHYIAMKIFIFIPVPRESICGEALKVKLEALTH